MKQSKITEIIEEKVLRKFTDKFKQKGFKYKKGIQGFYKRDNKLLYEISIENDYDLFMVQKGETERYNDLYITFEIFFRTELHAFEKWYKENFGGGDHLRIDTFGEALQFSILAREGIDFHIPDDLSPNQKDLFRRRNETFKSFA